VSNIEPHYFSTVTKQKPFTYKKPELQLHGKCSFISTSCLYFLSLVIYNGLQAAANRLNWLVKHSLKFMMPCRLVHKYQCFGAVATRTSLKMDAVNSFEKLVKYQYMKQHVICYYVLKELVFTTHGTNAVLFHPPPQPTFPAFPPTLDHLEQSSL